MCQRTGVVLDDVPEGTLLSYWPRVPPVCECNLDEPEGSLLLTGLRILWYTVTGHPWTWGTRDGKRSG